MKATPLSPARLPRRRILAVTLAVALLGITTVAAAVIESNPGPFTGCLASKTNKAMATTQGLIYNVAIGATPAKPCLASDTQVTFSNAEGPQGEPGEDGEDGADGAPGTPGGNAGIERVRWNFNIPAGALGSDRLGDTDLEPQSIATALAASLTLSAVPAGCASVDVDLNVVLGGNPFLANWFINDTSGDITDVAASNLLVATTNDNPHPLAGRLEIFAHCFDAGHLPMDPHITPAVTGFIVFEWNHAPRLIP